MNATVPFCGDLSTAFRLMPRHDPSGGVSALFSGRRVSFSFNTRVAIRKAVDILKLKPGDEVLAPAYNCGSELDPLRHAGLSIRLYPITESAEINPDHVARLVGPRTRAIYLTHYFGFLQPEMAALRALCNANGLYMIEDCALSLLSGNAPVDGRAGDVSLFCFYKFFPVLAGGALIINNDQIGAMAEFTRSVPGIIVTKHLLKAGLSEALGPSGAARILRFIKGQGNANRLQDAQPEVQPDMPGHYYFDPTLRETQISKITMKALQGFNIVQATAARRTNYLRLIEGISDIPGIEPIFNQLPPSAVPLSMPLRVTGGRGQRDAFVAKLQAEGIAATSWWSGYSRHLNFSDTPHANLSAARGLKDSVLSLPIHQYLGQTEIDCIAARVQNLAQYIRKH